MHRWTSLLLLAAAFPAVAAPPAPPVEELVGNALERSPALAARRAAVAASREMEGPARALPDPMVEAMLQNADFPEWTVGTMDMSMAGVEVSQDLLYPGKRRARFAAAQAETAVRAAELAAEERRVAAEVRLLYAKLYAVDRERQSLAAAAELVDMLQTTASTRYATGGSEQEALLKAQLRVSRLGEQIDDLEAERAGMVAELNRWLDRPGDALLGDVAALPPVTAPGAGWERAAAEASPDVARARAAVAAAQERLALARLETKPNLIPSAGLATRGSLGSVLTLRFGVELPAWKKSKQAGMIRAAEAELEMARRELDDALAQAQAEVTRLTARFRLAERQIVRFREGILLQTSATLDAARASYLAGRGDFSTIIEDFDLWLEARVQLTRREADRFAAWAEMEQLSPAGGRP
ncbi:MAG TPA: TolC family protein [Thermoanaerobaculia bacterium]|nr:TolC family protein [Thermoanaerobaculia bacterium]